MKIDKDKISEKSLSLFQIEELLKTLLKELDLEIAEQKIHSGIKKFFK